MSEPGELYVPRGPIRLHAVQLTGDADWKAIAEWCGGELHTERDVSDEYGSYLLVPRADGDGSTIASDDDWIVQGVTGAFFVKLPGEFAATYERIGGAR